MNTPLYSTKTRKPKTDIEYVDYNSIEEIINDLEEEDIFFEMMCNQEEGEAKPLIDWTKKKAHEKHEKNNKNSE